MDAAVGSDVPMHGVVAVTKLRVPELRATLVSRTALIAALDGRSGTRLTLVSGPAGAGKTTLVAQWHAVRRPQQRFAWLALDPADGDPVRFWGLVIAALRTVHEGFGTAAAAALRAGRGAVLDAVVPELVNEAALLPDETVLVLDDLHVLDGADEVHASLTALLDRLPPTVRIAATTRTEPALPIARLRARGQLDEVRAGDLRFSDADAAALLLRAFGVQLGDAELALLQAHTEGWAAGLQLAGISLSRRDADFATLMEAFSTPNADVLAYLAAEVLDGQPADVRDFLLQTSILDRLSGPLCEALTGTTGAAGRLEELARRNLLIEPLDAAHQWWRRHQLFAELLRHQARATLGDGALAALHRRAAAWHAEHGEPEDAVRHALSGDRPAVAAQLVAEHWEERFNRGELTVVAGWLDALPATELQRDPRLWLARLWTTLDRGRLDDAEAQLALAEATATPSVRAWGALLHALHAFKRGDLRAAAEALDLAPQVDATDAFWHTVAAHVHGLVACWHGSAAAAAHHFSRAETLAAADANRLGQAYALGYLALLAVDAGDGDEVRRRLTRVEALRTADAAIGEHFVASVAALALGRQLAREGAYEAAVPALERAMELAGRGAGRLEMAGARIVLAQVQRARGRRAAAETCLHEARSIVAACREPGRLRAQLARAERDVFGAPATDVDAAPLEPLTAGERAVLALLAGRLSQREIGQELFVSINTVKTHTRNIYAKLRASSREQAVGRARELGLLAKP